MTLRYTKGIKPGSTVQMTIYTKNLNGHTRATFWGTDMLVMTPGIFTHGNPKLKHWHL